MRKQSIEGEGTTLHVRHLEGISEAVWCMEHAKEQEYISGMAAASLEHDHDGWYQTCTMKEAVDLIRFGWEEGRRLLSRTLGVLSIDRLVGQRLAVEPRLSYSGDEVDIDTFLLGKPEHMIEYALRYDAGGKQATVLMNCSVPAAISAEQIMARGAVVLVAIEALRAEGYSLGLTMVEAAQSYRGRHVIEYHIPVVHPGGFLDADTVAFCVAHPSFLRRLVFALNEHEDPALRRAMGFHASGGYGAPVAIHSEIPPHSFVIDQGEGLNLRGDKALQQFAQQIVDKAIARLDT